VELSGRATRARVERIDVRAGTVVWRRCSRAAFIGRGTTGGGRSRSNRRLLGGASMAKPFRVGRKRGVGGEEQRCRFILPREGGGAHGGGGSGGARSDFRRKKTAGLTDRVGPTVSEGKASGRLGRKGREEVGRGWAGKGGRRWPATGLEKEGGGRAESIARAEIQNSKRKLFLIDFCIKITLEIE
jgi:hypothetical protein